MDHIGELAALHSRSDDILQSLVGGQLHLDAGLLLESLGHIGPALGAVGSLDSSDLDGHILSDSGLSSAGGLASGSRGLGVAGAAAAGQQSQQHGSRQGQTDKSFHFITSK